MKFRFSLALVALLLLLPACDLIMPEPEPPPEVILMLLPGFFEFDQPSVRIARGEHLISKGWPLTWDPDIGPFPELEPGQVRASYRLVFPKVIRCTDVAREVHVFPVPCPMQGRSVQEQGNQARHADPRRRVDDGCARPCSAVCQRRERRIP